MEKFVSNTKTLFDMIVPPELIPAFISEYQQKFPANKLSPENQAHIYEDVNGLHVKLELPKRLELEFTKFTNEFSQANKTVFFPVV